MRWLRGCVLNAQWVVVDKKKESYDYEHLVAVMLLVIFFGRVRSISPTRSEVPLHPHAAFPLNNYLIILSLSSIYNATMHNGTSGELVAFFLIILGNLLDEGTR